jgi:enoyl-CoA hydratase/carnithine racemase
MTARRIVLPPSLDRTGVEALAESLESAVAAREVRVVVLLGTEGTFCRGLDLEALVADANREARATAVLGFQRALLALRRGGKPAVAVVDGAALGGGVGLAAACDVVVATTRATFALPEALFGLAPAIIFPILLGRMTVQQARLLALTPQSRSALEARTLGLADEVVEPAEAERAVRRWVRALSRARSASARAIADLAASAAGRSLPEALASGGELTLAATEDPAVREALRRFRDDGWVGEEDE